MEMLRCILKRVGGVPTRHTHGSHDVPMCVHTREYRHKHTHTNTKTNTNKHTHSQSTVRDHAVAAPSSAVTECCSLILSIVVHSSSLSASSPLIACVMYACVNTVSQTGGGGEADEGGGVGGDGCDGVRPVMVSTASGQQCSGRRGETGPVKNTARTSWTLLTRCRQREPVLDWSNGSRQREPVDSSKTSGSSPGFHRFHRSAWTASIK